MVCGMTLNTEMVCPQCHAKGTVITRRIRKKMGVSGGKLALALFTVGVSILFMGLSSKSSVTKAECTKCNNSWIF
jgi:hypothetical protein